MIHQTCKTKLVALATCFLDPHGKCYVGRKLSLHITLNALLPRLNMVNPRHQLVRGYKSFVTGVKVDLPAGQVIKKTKTQSDRKVWIKAYSSQTIELKPTQNVFQDSPVDVHRDSLSDLTELSHSLHRNK